MALAASTLILVIVVVLVGDVTNDHSLCPSPNHFVNNSTDLMGSC